MAGKGFRGKVTLGPPEPRSWLPVDGWQNCWLHVQPNGDRMGLSTAFGPYHVPIGGLKVLDVEEARALGEMLLHWADVIDPPSEQAEHMTGLRRRQGAQLKLWESA